MKKTAKPFGNSSHIILPKSFAGKAVEIDEELMKRTATKMINDANNIDASNYGPGFPELEIDKDPEIESKGDKPQNKLEEEVVRAIKTRAKELGKALDQYKNSPINTIR